MDTLYIVYILGAIYIITNQKQFDEAIKKAILNCVSYISDKILECVQSHIWDDVYRYDYFPNRKYEDGTKMPTFQFLNAFKFEEMKIKSDEISAKLFYDWQKMEPPSLNHPFTHGVYGVEDTRSVLAELLNVTGISGYKKRNAFWDNAIEEIEQKFNLWAREAYNKYLK